MFRSFVFLLAISSAITTYILFTNVAQAQSLSVPVYESFDNAGPTLTYGESVASIDGLPGWNYVTSAGGRLTFRPDFEIHNGSEYIASMDNPNCDCTNQLIATIDANGLQAATDRVVLAFDWYDHGDESDAPDTVSIRGSDTDAWIEVYNFGTNSNNGSWTKVRDIDLSDALANAIPAQEFSSTFQIRFQQNDNFPINTDGISIEDVSIEVAAASADNASPVPGTLIATMVDYRDREVPNGDELEYKVSLINPLGGGDAESALFQMASFGAQTELVQGSVITSQGAVIMGNGMFDDKITVLVGDIPDGESETIYFRVRVDYEDNRDVFNQGLVSALNVGTFVTQDPSIDSGGMAEQTYARIAPLEQIISNFQVNRSNPDLGDVLLVSADGGPSNQPVVFSSTTPAICEIVMNDRVRTLAEGECILQADQAGDATYAPGTEQLAFSVGPASPLYIIPIPGQDKVVVVPL
jgi:hypothetical protein